MKTNTAIFSVSNDIFRYEIGSPTNGTSALTGSTQNLNLPDVSSNQYTTIYSTSFSVSDQGFIDVYSLFVNLRLKIKGNGSYRWQISGNGGTTFITIAELSFNVGAFTNSTRLGSGTWISSIDTGPDKLQLILQSLANVGTVNIQLRGETSFIRPQIRRKLGAQ